MDFQAFIFCGKGYKLSPFSHIREESGIPKALLPVANRHMIEYVLDWCDQANFKEINIVADASEVDVIREALKTYLSVREAQFELLAKSLPSHHSHHTRKPAPVNFIEAKSEFTGEILQKVLFDKITGDFVLLPCDFITDIPPQVFIDQYRNKDSDNLAMAVYYKNTFENIDKKQLPSFYHVYSDNEDSIKQPVLLDVYSNEDVERSKDLQIRTQMLWRFPNAIVSKKLLNSFIYFCCHDLVELLSKEDDSKSTSEGDSIDSEDENAVLNQQMETHPSHIRRKNKLAKDPINCNKSIAKIFRDLARRTWQHTKTRESIGIFILPNVGAFIRSNNLSAYMEANRYVLRIKSSSMATQTAPTTGSAIGADSVVGVNCTIAEKTSVKLSVLGKDCKIGKRCRIIGSLILDGAEIEDETTLENVIIGNFAKIGKRSKLTNSYVEGSYIVNPKSVLKNETLTHIYLEETDFTDDALSTSDEGDSSEFTDEYYEEDEFEDDGLFER
ncbi:LAFE_0G07910g1_1 [Lachancea fermentati]|uniref:Translation initiation factor eIF2B subunit gamma n=1 Tax=Lachancea fermentati TaxID=4955 RepID=A0A1G4MHK4_LACFM|nr:LAFE_0G07910g1_1 [Lachancea fermentati]